MARYPGFCGPFARDSTRSFNVEDTVNLYLRPGDSGTPKSRTELVIRPCLRPHTSLPSGPVRALFFQDGRAFAVGGGHFCEFWDNGEVADWGDVAVDARPATISSNGTAGNQLFITSGGLGYIFDLVNNDLTQITDDSFPVPALTGCFVDGYFAVLKGQSRQFYISSLEEGETWDALDAGEVSTTSENIVTLACSHRELWLFGSKTTQVWYDSGDAGFPFQPVQGVFIEHGCIAPWSVAQLDNTLFWLGQDARGAGVVWRANGYTPQRVSTFAVEQYIQSLPEYTDAIAWTFQEFGSLFYLLYLPVADTTLVYDVATQQWARWAVWNPDTYHWMPHLGRCHAWAFNKHLVGDRQSGTVYHQSPDFYDDEAVVGTSILAG